MQNKIWSLLLLLIVAIGFSGAASAAPVEDFTQDLLVLHENGEDDYLYDSQTGKHTLHFNDTSSSAPVYADTVGSDGWGYWDANADDETYPSYGSEVVDQYKASGAISGTFHFLVLDQKDGPKIVLSHVQDLVFPQPPKPPENPPVPDPKPPEVPDPKPPVVPPVTPPVEDNEVPLKDLPTGGKATGIALAILGILVVGGYVAMKRNK